MNLHQRSSRYSNTVMFCVGIAGGMILASGIATGFRADLEHVLAAGLIVSLILHARAGFALSRTQQEVELIGDQMQRLKTTPRKDANKFQYTGSSLSTDNGVDPDFHALDRVRNALENGQVNLHLQPVVSLPGRSHCFLEAYSRLHDARGVMLSPASYLRAAERCNQIGLIDNMVLLRAVQSLRGLADYSAGQKVFCNVSPATIFDVDFFARFTDYLDANADLCDRLVFEFTQPAVNLMAGRVQQNMEILEKRGFSFSVDHVQRLDMNWEDLRAKNFRYVKVSAQTLINEMGKDGADQRLSALKQQLDDLGITVIVEKIEQEDQLRQIGKLGVRYVQGNLFGRPISDAEYMSRIAALPQAS